MRPTPTFRFRLRKYARSAPLYPVQEQSLRQLFADGFDLARPRLVRSMTEFATSCIVCPSGPFKDQRFRLERQPFARELLALFDSQHQVREQRFSRFAITGPVQTGKTFAAVVIPVLYHLFELRENVIYGIPQMEMAGDKWRQDLLPAILASGFGSQIPVAGKGSRGGSFESITFKCGSTLKFMSAKGDDSKRSGFTARVLAMTEVDKYDEASDSSRETNPVNQMIARLDAYELENSVVYMECSPSVPTGRIWTEYAKAPGRLAMPCPHCLDYVTLERESLVGWQDAATELDARDNAAFACPACGGIWSEQQRIDANKAAVLLFPGQTVVDGVASGPLPRSTTAGFRWNAANNLLKPAKDVATKEWQALHTTGDPESSEKAIVQFTWALPWDGSERDSIDLDEVRICSRLTGLDRYVVPDDYESLVAHVDIHNRWHYVVVVATSPGSVRSIVHYDIVHTPYAGGGETPESAIRKGLESVRDQLTAAPWRTQSGKQISLDLIGIDAGYKEDVSLEFVGLAGPRWQLAKGLGLETSFKQKDRTPDHRPGFHLFESRQPGRASSQNRRWWLAITHTHYWMGQVHGGLFPEPESPRRAGSLALFGSDPAVHRTPVDRDQARSSFAAQILAWRLDEREKWVPTYSRDGRDDHFFDATYNALALHQLVISRRESAAQAPVNLAEWFR